MNRNHSNRGGIKCFVAGKDMLLTLFTTMINGRHLDVLGKFFAISTLSIETVISKCSVLISGHIYKTFVSYLTDSVSLQDLEEMKCTVYNLPNALYAVDGASQRSFQPSGSIEEGKIYFSGKHHLHGVKVEVGVLPNSLASCFKNHYPGSILDSGTFQRLKTFIFSEEES